ncbi:MAG: Ltp family lipoprotein [Streptococcaceae bacterium]|jgi:hypothetical protein|nr:Ltp family lipoprotein [Streptococcaceae bacterium]
MKKKPLLFIAAAILGICLSDKAMADTQMQRLYNPNSGEHFYTASINERTSLVNAGWSYEGISWIAPDSGDAVYRLYNPNAGDHFYTRSINERDSLVKAGWKAEGIGWYSGGSVSLLRAYNPNAAAGSHNYTTAPFEQESLLKAGWRDEGVAWYGTGSGFPITQETINALTRVLAYQENGYYMSRLGYINQLTVDGFTTEDATFAVDSSGIDWNQNALTAAKIYYGSYYSDSKDRIYELLTVPGGFLFTAEEAQYAIDHL